jgi:hypothetical protein
MMIVMNLSNNSSKHPWIIVYVPQGTSSPDVYQKIYSKVCGDFYTERLGDHSVMLSIPSLTSSTAAANSSSSGGKGVINERTVPPTTTLLNQQVYASLADLLGKLRDGVITSFLQRSALYDADIRRLDSLRGSIQFDFLQLFLVKESYALMYQMMQMPDRSFILYEELESLLIIAPMASLPDNDWPMIADPTITTSSKTKPSQPTDNTSSSSSSSMPQTNASTNNSTTATDQQQVQNTPDRNMPIDDQSIQASFNSTINSNNNTPISNKTILKSRNNNIMNDKDIPSKGDLFTDACRNGEDIIAYSINQARMNILYNKYSYLQLQHYIFARQMYFLLIHLRQPIKCAEKALSYIIISNVNIEKRIQAIHSKLMSSNSNELTSDNVTVDSTDSVTHSEIQQMQLMELRIAQCNVWTIVSALRLIRECRALLQLLVGDDSIGGDNNDRLSGYYSMRSSSCQHSMMMMIGSDSLEDNLAAISSASTHGNSVVYQSLAELSRSQHGLSHGRKHGSSLETTPANIIREALFSPQTEINIVLRDSSKVLSDLMDYALKKLHLISQSFQAKKITKLSMELALSTSLYSASSSSSSSSSSVVEQLHLDGASIRNRTITKFIPSKSTTIHTDSIISTSSMDTTHGLVIQPMIRGKKINPSNEDIITCIEQELQLLDDANVDIGNRMDQVTK